MERQPRGSTSEDTGFNLVSNSPDPEIIFPDESWELEKRNPEFQSIYRQIKQFRTALRDRRDTIADVEGVSFAYTTYDNAYRLVSAAYFLLANADEISRSSKPAGITSNAQTELRTEFMDEIIEVLGSLGIEPQELRR